MTYNFDYSCFFDEQQKIRFDPPVYEQRYLTVLRLLELDCLKGSIKKIVEFGCADMKFFTLLKTLDVEQILQIDIDEELLTKSLYNVRPLFVDFIQRRAKNFSVEVWRGSIASPHDCLKDTDVVIGIEIIEHLFPLVLEAVPQNVFGFIRPKVAMFSTPNSEYNVHFDGLLENGFRHEDHKFEWTRAQFKEWCENICHRYPEYSVKYFGIGPPPKNSADVGYVSQLGVFVRNDFLEQISLAKAQCESENGHDASDLPSPIPSTSENVPVQAPNIYFDDEVGEIVVAREEDGEAVGNPAEPPNPGIFRDDLEDLESTEDDLDFSDRDDEPLGRDIDYYIPIEERTRNDSGNYEDDPLDPTSEEYKLLFTVDYPVQEPDNRERPERLLDEATYQIRRLKMQQESEYYNYENNIYRIPLQLVVDCMSNLTTNLNELRPILTNASYRITEDNLVTLNGDDESVEGSEEDFEYDYHGQEDDLVSGDNGQNVQNQESSLGNPFHEDEELWD